MKGTRFNSGQAYVAFSLVKKLEGLYIMNFNEKAIKASKDVMVRLNKNLLSPLSVYTRPHNYITIAFLNVECTSILFLTETWLSPQMITPCVRGNTQSIRAD